MEGKVKWFNEKKGYGFIQSTEGKEYFVHYKNINGNGFKNLLEDQRVSFEAFDEPKGPVAKDVKVI